MVFLISEMIFALVIAACLGALIGWLGRGLIIDRELDQLKILLKERAPAAPPADLVTQAPEPRNPLLEEQLAEYHSPLRNLAEADDLTRLRGVGPAVAHALEELGITQYRQIASWSDEQHELIRTQLSSRLRAPIRSKTWITQARKLGASQS